MKFWPHIVYRPEWDRYYVKAWTFGLCDWVYLSADGDWYFIPFSSEGHVTADGAEMRYQRYKTDKAPVKRKQEEVTKWLKY